MGDDPLAWLHGEAGGDSADAPAEKPARKRRSAAAEKSAPDTADLIESSFELLAPHGGELVAKFYDTLFERHPEVEPLFAGTSREEQDLKLLGALQLAVANIRKPDVLGPVLVELGHKHQGYGVLPEHFEAAGGILLETLAELAGEHWNDDLAQAWATTYTDISELMLSGYEPDEDTTMAAESVAVLAPQQGDEQTVRSELNKMRSAVDGAMTAIMMVDRELTITYMNESARTLLRENEDELRKIYRGFDVDNMIGMSADFFHADPSHQQRLLADPNNLPWRTDITVGPLKLALNVTAIIDEQGNYLGNTLEMADVTETRAREAENARLQSAIKGATTRLMMCDDDLNIVYANPAVMEMFRNRAAEMRQAFPGFDPENLIGQNIDKFHKNPAHQRKLLKDPSMLPAKATIHMLDLVFEVNATMILGPKGEYRGNMVEWVDMTEQFNAEQELSNLVKAASEGDFSVSMDVSRYKGFYRTLGGTINGIMIGLKDLSQVLASMSRGDLTCGMRGDYDGLFAKFKLDVNATVDVLRDTVQQILASSANISASSSEISEGNSDLLQRTESQASSLEETASSMEEMTAAVKSSADNARQANQLASSAREQAEVGGQVVRRAIDAMGEINKSSSQIADIISVIDEIAFQTNLLALNAAVEAARAGEQGRGFAVVAAEVRNLAQRSAEAAKEIKTLIKDSVIKVEDGSRLVGESGNTLDEIVTAVKKVSDIIAEIAAAAQEQSLGIEQVNTAVSQLDEVTQKNAAMVEE
ncbi:PAS domain-containing protein, partial [Mangrovimicrobium sediminis]